MTQRKCGGCGKSKPADEFRHRRAKCRDCFNAYRREWFHRAGPAQKADRARAARVRGSHQEATLRTATNGGAPWDQQQDRIILDNWNRPSRELAGILNRSYDSINARKKKLTRAGIDHV